MPPACYIYDMELSCFRAFNPIVLIMDRTRSVGHVSIPSWDGHDRAGCREPQLIYHLGHPTSLKAKAHNPERQCADRICRRTRTRQIGRAATPLIGWLEGADGWGSALSIGSRVRRRVDGFQVGTPAAHAEISPLTRVRPSEKVATIQGLARAYSPCLRRFHQALVEARTVQDEGSVRQGVEGPAKVTSRQPSFHEPIDPVSIFPGEDQSATAHGSVWPRSRIRRSPVCGSPASWMRSSPVGERRRALSVTMGRS
jgi:hypothetical protein